MDMFSASFFGSTGENSMAGTVRTRRCSSSRRKNAPSLQECFGNLHNPFCEMVNPFIDQMLHNAMGGGNLGAPTPAIPIPSSQDVPQPSAAVVLEQPYSETRSQGCGRRRTMRTSQQELQQEPALLGGPGGIPSGAPISSLGRPITRGASQQSKQTKLKSTSLSNLTTRQILDKIHGTKKDTHKQEKKGTPSSYKRNPSGFQNVSNLKKSPSFSQNVPNIKSKSSFVKGSSRLKQNAKQAGKRNPSPSHKASNDKKLKPSIIISSIPGKLKKEGKPSLAIQKGQNSEVGIRKPTLAIQKGQYSEVGIRGLPLKRKRESCN